MNLSVKKQSFHSNIANLKHFHIYVYAISMIVLNIVLILQWQLIRITITDFQCISTMVIKKSLLTEQQWLTEIKRAY